MASQVAGPSRIALGYISDPLSINERQRKLATNKKAERVLGAPAPSALLDVHFKAGLSSTLKPQSSSAVVLNSPVSSAPPSAFRPYSSSDPAEGSSTAPSPSGAQHYVPPLKFKRESFRANSSASLTDAELIEFGRDLSADVSRAESSSPHSSSDERQVRLIRSDSSLRRHPRPLPPVPPCASSSRPVSPVPSLSSANNTPPGPMRPLPLPPDPVSNKRPVSGESVSTIGFAPPSPRLKCLIPNVSTTSLTCSPIDPAPETGKDDNKENVAESPISAISVATDATSALSILTPKFGMFMHAAPRATTGTIAVGIAAGGADRQQKHASRVHASPYKLSRSASRYSVTSLSSQVSVPPAPTAAELRRRNREKMAKLIRMLGDSPPREMVFAIESAYAGLQAELDKEVEIEKANVKRKEAKRVEAAGLKMQSPNAEAPSKTPKSKVELVAPPSVERPSLSSVSSDTKSHGRSISLTNDADSIFSKKALSDPDAGHSLSFINSRTTFTTNTTTNTTSPFARLRPKKGRSGASAERYVVSLAGSDAERVSLRLAGSGADPHRKKPSGSYLRGAYKADSRTLEAKIPPLPHSRVSLLAGKPRLNLPQESADKANDTRKWLREAGSTRWEVDDYENVVKSLRKL